MHTYMQVACNIFIKNVYSHTYIKKTIDETIFYKYSITMYLFHMWYVFIFYICFHVYLFIIFIYLFLLIFSFVDQNDPE